MTLGFVDLSTGVITLSNYVTNAGQTFNATFEPGVYAWVIQSTNGNLGATYQLQYNMAFPVASQVIFTSSDLQQVYAVSNQKLTINGQVQNLNYRYDSEWELPTLGGGGEKKWNKIHVWMEYANVQAIHVGGAQYYASGNLYSFPHSIVFAVREGGTFTHQFSQNPPYYNWYNKDAAGLETPRSINSTGAC